jgi:hypothetical protein
MASIMRPVYDQKCRGPTVLVVWELVPLSGSLREFRRKSRTLTGFFCASLLGIPVLAKFLLPPMLQHRGY